MAACSLLFIIILLAFTWQRYRQIKRLCEYLKRINSGDYALDLRDNTEGELSILKSEIYKVTVMLRERGETLKREKAALADALSDISHQLKTPLTSMLIMTDLLCDAALPEDSAARSRAACGCSSSGCNGSSRRCSRCRGWTPGPSNSTRARLPQRRSSKRPAPRCSSPWSSKTLSCASRRAKIALTCDENWTAEALLNILKNCVEHTPEGGGIAISCEENPLFTQISIRDTGPGIDEIDLPHIFSRFYRGKNAAEDSVGIGLAMAAAIVQKQGGSIAAASSHEGSIFTLRFPSNR